MVFSTVCLSTHKRMAISVSMVGGQVVGDEGMCASSSIAAMPRFFGGEGQRLRDDNIPELIVLPFERLRKLMGEHQAVKELLALNREAASAVEHAAFTDEDLRQELISTVLSLSHLANVELWQSVIT
jgi:hypothetical protein